MSSREIMNAQGFGKKKYSLDCSYYDKEFDSIDELNKLENKLYKINKQIALYDEF